METIIEHPLFVISCLIGYALMVFMAYREIRGPRLGRWWEAWITSVYTLRSLDFGKVFFDNIWQGFLLFIIIYFLPYALVKTILKRRRKTNLYN